MSGGISKWLAKRYPQNYIFKNPFIGSLIFLALCVFFVLLYKPLQLHRSRWFGYELTVAVYCVILALPIAGVIRLIKYIRFFSNPGEWTVLKEILSIVITLLCMGIIVYFSGFLLETPDRRWSLSTFFDSLISASLIGIIPFVFFTVINYRHLFVSDITTNFNTDINSGAPEKPEEMLRIGSQLKKEELAFYPSQFIYAESDGNYTVFYLSVESQIKKKVIRNSITNIEQQLSSIPFLFRTHRAFIINVKKVSSQKGNTLGYHLKLAGIDTEIPVARQKTRDFENILKEFHQSVHHRNIPSVPGLN